jgi:hypothetical protein
MMRAPKDWNAHSLIIVRGDGFERRQSPEGHELTAHGGLVGTDHAILEAPERLLVQGARMVGDDDRGANA